MSEEKVCTECKRQLPKDQFPPQRRVCLDCIASVRKRYGQSVPVEIRRERDKWNRIWKSYRLRKQEYLDLIAGGCEVCGTQEDLCIDHDHSCCSGKYTCGGCVRGVLCKRHNTAEGLLDSVEQIEALLAYRKKNL